MKIATLSTVVALLSDLDFENKETLMNELYTELNRGAAIKAEKASVYEAAKPIVFAQFDLTTAPLTVAELWEAIEGEAPEGFTKGKLSYAMTHTWADEVVKVEGKVNAYRKA